MYISMVFTSNASKVGCTDFADSHWELEMNQNEVFCIETMRMFSISSGFATREPRTRPLHCI